MNRTGIGMRQNTLAKLKCEDKCCICGAEIRLLSELYDAFPLFDSDGEAQGEGDNCCYSCFNQVVVPARILLLQRRFHPGQAWTGFYTTVQDQELIVPLIDLKSRTHYYKNERETACGVAVACRGRHLATRRNGSVTDINCPECRRILEDSYGD